MRQINKIIIHCSATPEGRKTSAEEIKSWHLERGFSDIGYHYIVHLDGSISYGRNIDKIGAHSRGQNKMSIGVCYIGGLNECLDPKDTRTPQQKETLLILLKTLKKLHSKAVIYGHRDFSEKACPSFNAFDEYKFIE
jgi:N-acetylmuramoyl-L-alanine amidase